MNTLSLDVAPESSSLPVSENGIIRIDDASNRTVSKAAVASRIRRLIEAFPTRKAAGLAGGVSHTSIHNYLTGSNEPSFTTLARMALALGYSLDWLATGSGSHLASPPPARKRKPRVAAAVLERDLRRANAHAATLAECLRDALAGRSLNARVSQRRAALECGIDPRQLNRLLHPSSRRPKEEDAVVRPAIEQWLIRRGACASCVRSADRAQLTAMLQAGHIALPRKRREHVESTAAEGAPL